MSKKITFAPRKEPGPFNVWKHWKFPQNDISIEGYSRSADRTFLYIPEWKIGLDCGICHGRKPNHVFLTHSHIDHSKDVPWVCQTEGVQLFCPKEATGFVDSYVKAEDILNNCGRVFEPRPYKIIGVEDGDVLNVGDKLRVRVVKCYHSVPCVGFCFDVKRKKLKPEYTHLTGKEIAKLRKEGTQIDHDIHLPAFVYLGDTSVEVFDKNPQLFDYPVIICECTFIHAEGVEERIKRDGHILWAQLEKHVLAHPKNTFVLIHFSLRYKEHQIFAFFNDLVNREQDPLDLSNLVIFVGDGSEGR